jgi:hypothetical protein
VTACGDGDEDLLNDLILPHDAAAEGGFEFVITFNESGSGGGV